MLSVRGSCHITCGSCFLVDLYRNMDHVTSRTNRHTHHSRLWDLILLISTEKRGYLSPSVLCV